MNWLILVCTVTVIIHLSAIIFGRKTNTKEKKIAFTSGILGFFSFPVLLYLAVKNFCIAGACRGVDSTALNLAAITFIALALLSTISLAVIFARHNHA